MFGERVLTIAEIRYIDAGACPKCGWGLVQDPTTGEMTSCFNLCHLAKDWPARTIGFLYAQSRGS